MDYKVEFKELLEYYYDHHESGCVGGNLHIALDDGNLEDGNLWFCYEQAEKERDLLGMYLASTMWTMTMEGREKVREAYLRFK